MREAVGDLFTYPSDCLVIPINWTTKANGDAVMGAGVAKEAARRWPWLPASLGNFIGRSTSPAALTFQAHRDDSDGLFHVVCVPTKHDWREPSTVGLVDLGAKALVVQVDRAGWQTVALPRLGCGEKTGRLSWSDVKPILAGLLDDRFVVCSPEPR